MSTALPTTPTTEPRDRRRRRGVVFLKFGLAGAALLGIAAAATSAAWTDNAWFSASASAATVQLQGALGANPASTDWQDADTSSAGSAIAVDSSVFGNLLPGDDVTVQLNVRNNGSTKLTLTAPSINLPTTGDQIFALTNDGTHAYVSSSALSSSTLAPNATAYVTLEVKVPSTWDAANQGKAESFTVSFNGTATH